MNASKFFINKFFPKTSISPLISITPRINNNELINVIIRYTRKTLKFLVKLNLKPLDIRRTIKTNVAIKIIGL